MGSGNIGRDHQHQVALIANGAAVSTKIDLQRHVLVAIIMPAAWTAAGLTFQAPRYAADGSVTWINVHDDAGAEVEIVSANAPVDRAIVNASILEKLAGLHEFRIRSGNAATPVNQAAERRIVVLTKG